METTIIEYQIRQIEKELQALKLLLTKIKYKKRKASFASLAGILDEVTDLSLEEIQSFKYKPESIK